MKQAIATRGRARKTPAPSPKVDKLAYSINDLHELGFGCRAYIYGEINAGRLRATKRGRYTVVLVQDLDAWGSFAAGDQTSKRDGGRITNSA
jgi:hypothetical protein